MAEPEADGSPTPLEPPTMAERCQELRDILDYDFVYSVHDNEAINLLGEEHGWAVTVADADAADWGDDDE